MDIVFHIGEHGTGSGIVAPSISAHPDCEAAPWGARRLRDVLGFQAITLRIYDPAESDAFSAKRYDHLIKQMHSEVDLVCDTGAAAQ